MKRLYRANLARSMGEVDQQALQRNLTLRPGRWTRLVIRPLMIASMIGALMYGLTTLIVQVIGDDQWPGTTWLFMIVALEGIYTTMWLRHPDRMVIDKTAYRVSELLLLFIVVRLSTWMIFIQHRPVLAEFQEYLSSPLSLFVDIPFLISLLLALVAWRLALEMSKLFSKLDLSQFELRFYSLPPAVRKARADDQPIRSSRGTVVRSIARLWGWGGVLLVIVVGLSTLEMRSGLSLLNPLVAGSVNLPAPLLLALLIYFGSGLWLLSQAKLMEMNARWLLNGVDRDSNLARFWQQRSLLLLLGVGMVAAFLPIGSTVALGRLVNALVYGLLVLVNLIIYLLLAPFALLLSLLSNSFSEEAPVPPALPTEPFASLPETAPSELTNILSMVFGSAFWAIFIVASIAGLLFFLRERKIRVTGNGRASLRMWQRLLGWLRAVLASLSLRVRSLQLPRVDRIMRVRNQESSAPRQRFRFFRIGSLSPREQMRFFYLSIVRRARDEGVAREPGETPAEYTSDLRRSWPEAEIEISELTDAFNKARYSDRPITEDDLPPVKDSWKNARRQIRKPHKPAADEDETGGM